MQVLQGYDCDILHIAGKSNPSDFLSRRSVKELQSMVDVRALEESIVQRLRLGDQQPTDEDIQKKLDEVFKGQEQIKTNSLYSVKSFRGLAVARSQISLESQLRASFIEGYQIDTKWADILIELQSDPQKKTIIQGRKWYKLSSKLFGISGPRRREPDMENCGSQGSSN